MRWIWESPDANATSLVTSVGLAQLAFTECSMCARHLVCSHDSHVGWRSCPHFAENLASKALFSSVQSLSPVQLFATPWTTAHQASLSITNSQSLLKLMFIEWVMPPSHLILCYPLLLLPSIFPSIEVFSKKSVLRIRWSKYWSFSPSNEYSGRILFRMDWLGLLAVQGTLKDLVSSNTTVQKHQFFSTHLSL